MSESSPWRNELLAQLREAHHSEAAPPALKRRILEDLAAPDTNDLGIGHLARIARALCALSGAARALRAPALTLASLALLVTFGWDALRGSIAGLKLGPEPNALIGSAPEPPASAADVGAPSEPIPSVERPAGSRPCPLAEVPPSAVLLPEGSPGVRTDGLIFTVRMPTAHCGPLERRYVQIVPNAVSHNTRAPVLILLHDSGQSAEQLRIQQTIWHFDEVALREGLVVIYANAAPSRATQITVPNSGGWQTDDDAHPEIDDERYLLRIRAELRAHGVIAGDNDVYLIGFGAGARMALAAAAARPDVYAGVAALMLRNPEQVAKPFLFARTPRLTRALFVDHGDPARDGLEPRLQAAAEEWALGLGISALVVPSQREASRAPRPPSRVQRRALAGEGSVWQWDMATPSSGGAAVRIVVLDRGVGPFPLPLGGKHPGGAAAERRGLAGARETWAFLSGDDAVPPSVGEPLPASDEDAAIDDDLFDPPIRFRADVVTPEAAPDMREMPF